MSIDLKNPENVALLNVQSLMIFDGMDIEDAIDDEKFSGRLGIMVNVIDWNRIRERLHCNVCGNLNLSSVDETCENCQGTFADPSLYHREQP